MEIIESVKVILAIIIISICLPLAVASLMAIGALLQSYLTQKENEHLKLSGKEKIVKWIFGFDVNQWTNRAENIKSLLENIKESKDLFWYLLLFLIAVTPIVLFFSFCE